MPIKRVLIIEDNEDDYLIVRNLLSDIPAQQFDVEWVENIEDAREALTLRRFDICLVDHGLVGRKGLALIEEQILGDPPFILLTGNEDHEIDIAATKAGAMDYLVKGHINAPLLERSIRYAIEHAKHAKVLEAALGQSRLLATAVSNFTDGMVITDARQAENPIIFANAAFCALTGYASEEILGRNCRFLQGAETDPQVVQEIREAIEQRRAFKGVILNYRKDGTAFWNGLKVTPVFDEKGELTHFVGMQSDVTERRQSEIALRDSEARSRAVIHNALDSILIIDHEARVVEFNPAAEATFGYSRAEALGRDICDLIVPPAFRQAYKEGFLRYLATGDGPVLNKRIEILARCKDGREILVELGATAMTHCDPPQFIAYLRDVTERKRAEEALRASEELFASIVANVPGMVYQFAWHLDGSLEWPFVSQGCRALFEMEPQALKRDPNLPLNLIHPHDQGEFNRSMMAAKQNLTPWSWEGRLQMPIGKIKWVQGASYPQRLPQGGTVCTGLFMDITRRKEAEAERDRFFTLSLDMMGVTDLDGYFKRLNPAFSETLGYDEAELLTRPFSDFVHPEDQAATLTAMKKLSTGDLVVDFENRYRAKDGTYRWIEWKSAVEDGLIYTAARDVTDRKTAEAALLRANDELEARVVRRTVKLEQTNTALQFEIAERAGAEAQTRARARQQEAVAELGRRALADIDMDTLLQGAAALVAATLDVEFSSISELMPGGETLRFRASSGWKIGTDVVVPADSQSQSGYALFCKTPTIITDLRTETRFIPSPFLLESGIVSGVKVIIGGYEKPFGTLGAHTIHERYFTQDDVNFLQSVSNIVAAAIGRHRVEGEMHALNAQLRHSNELLGHSNEQLRIENIEHQVTMATLNEAVKAHQEAKDEADRANRAKSEFLSRMSHELRTPLNAILGFGQILDRQELTALQSEGVGYILKGGRHLLSLINEVLDIARVEAGHVELSIEPVDVGEVVGECCALVQPLAEEHQIRLVEAVSGESSLEGVYLLADRQRLKQVLLNLLSNAIKYNRSGGQVTLGVQVVPGRLSGKEASIEGLSGESWVQVGVRDTGPGLSAEELGKLFTPFERLHAADSTIEGTGLGLVISQRLLSAMGGHLKVQSAPGQGSTFCIELPLARSPLQSLEQTPSVEQALTLAKAPSEAPDEDSDQDTEDKAAEGEANSPSKVHTHTVLCIEDNLSNIRLLEAVLLNRPRVRLLTAMQGSLGLDLARQHQPDVILLDLHLPGLSGSEVLARLRQSDQTREIPVIVISADATPSQIERLLEAGALAYLTKPLDVKAFLQILDQVLFNHSTE